MHNMILQDNPRTYAIMRNAPALCGEAATLTSSIDHEGVGGGSMARSIGEAGMHRSEAEGRFGASRTRRARKRLRGAFLTTFGV